MPRPGRAVAASRSHSGNPATAWSGWCVRPGEWVGDGEPQPEPVRLISAAFAFLARRPPPEAEMGEGGLRSCSPARDQPLRRGCCRHWASGPGD